MIAFSTYETIISVLYAALYGACFCILYSLMIILRNIINSLVDLMRNIVCYDKIFVLPKGIVSKNDRNIGAPFLFISVILYVIGIVLVSYAALDGIIRLYMIIISSALFFLLKNTFFSKLNKLFFVIFDYFMSFGCILMRIILFPAKFLYNKIKNYFSNTRA